MTGFETIKTQENEAVEKLVHDSLAGEKELLAGRTENYIAYGLGTRTNLLRRRSPDTETDEVGDNFLMVPEWDLTAVFDGVSQANGAAGAKVAADELKKRIEVMKDKFKPRETTVVEARKVLLALLRSVNGVLSDWNKDKHQSEQYLTTMTLSMRVGAEMIVVNIGDSRAYYQRAGQPLEAVTVDYDAMRYDLEQRGKVPTTIDEVTGQGGQNIAEIRAAQSRRPKMLANRVSRLLGQSSRLDFAADVYVRKVKSGDRFMLCSDGIVKEVREENLADSLSPFTNRNFKDSAAEIMADATRTEYDHEHDDKVLAVVEIK
ncbi:TPA: hypothetical protein DF272_00700 [Candidatus Falkowbacteria bacterium]|nr:hypothetical protein [Candidatus Falkowbacteria bacterium]